MPSNAELLLIGTILTFAAALGILGRSVGWRVLFPDTLHGAAVIPIGLALAALADIAIRLTILDVEVSRVRGAGVVVLAVVLLWVNRRHMGPRWQSAAIWLASLGTAFNGLATAARGGMPVVVSAARSVGFDVSSDPGPGYVWAESPGPVDWVFGDSIPLHGLHTVVSLGDLLILGGFPLLLVWFLVGVFCPAVTTSPMSQPMKGGVK